VRALAGATELPVSVDLEDGYGDPAQAIRRVAAAGAVGGSIEDYDPAGRIRPVGEAVERLRAAVEAARALEFPFTLTGRAENHIRGNPDLGDTIARLVAYEQAGADVLYAPGLRDPKQIRTVADAISKPLNVLAHRGLSMAEIAQAGGQRVSLGGALAWSGVAGFVEAAGRIRDAGDFSGLAAPPPGGWLS
jgi:2-methylisocitrate lyase-like PEP mutase family enzyme